MRRKTTEAPTKDASTLSIAIIVSAYNSDITEPMLEGAKETLRAWGVRDTRVQVIRVPGAFELPYGALLALSTKKKPDAIITLGCIVKGETEHDRYIANAVSEGLMNLSLAHHVPISFGVLTTNNLAQARARSRGNDNKGKEAAVAALSMALLVP